MPSDEPPPYIVKFIIQKLESPALVSGAMYSVSYRRGTFRGTTPASICDGGVVSFSTMPEGCAMVHFKPNTSGSKGSGRYQNKYITLSIEEVATHQKKQVGLVEFDVANCLRGQERSCRVLKHADFRMSGFGASVEILVTLYPEGESPPPAVPPRLAGSVGAAARTPTTPLTPVTAQTATRPSVNPPAAAQGASSEQGCKRLSRDDALTLLMSVESLMEQQGGVTMANYRPEESSAVRQQIAQLEERIQLLRTKMNANAMMKRAAVNVAVAETATFVRAQFQGLEESDAANKFVADVAQHLKEHAPQGQQPQTSAKDIRAKIQRVQQDLKQLHDDQEVLGQLQLKRDVGDELVANLSKVHDKEQQLLRLQTMLDAATSLESSTGGWAGAKSSVLEEINALRLKRDSLTQVADDGRSVLALRITEWATRRCAPLREYDRLQREAKHNAEEEDKLRKAAAQRHLHTQMSDLFGGMESGPQGAPQPAASAPPPPAPPAAAVDAFADLYNAVPAANDFAPSVVNRGAPVPTQEPPKVNNPTEYQFADPAATPPPSSQVMPSHHQDPFSDLRGNLFEQPTPQPQAQKAATPPKSSQVTEYNFGEATVESTSVSSSTACARQPAVETSAAAKLQSEMRRTYVFGEEDPTVSKRSSSGQSGTSASVEAPAYSFAPTAAEYSFAPSVVGPRVTVDFSSNPTPFEIRQQIESSMAPISGSALSGQTRSDDSFWGSPITRVSSTTAPAGQQSQGLAASRPPQILTAPSYDFGPSGNSSTYPPPSNMFDSFAAQ